jgi:hypothetical protein
LTQPQSSTKSVGSAASFNVSAGGDLPPSYQWRLNGTNLVNSARISGATTNALSISSVRTEDEGSYTVVVANALLALNSEVATLTVQAPPQITSQPQSRTNSPGTSATFAISARGSPSPSYQWRFNGTNIAGATTNSLVLRNVQAADVGSYLVAITNALGNTNSDPATLTVVQYLPGIINQRVEGTNLYVGGTGGVAGSTYYVVSSINLTQWLTNWLHVATNVFENDGTFSVTNAVDPAKQGEFFRLQLP